MQSPVIATYGHGTHNDFAILFDPDDQLAITAPQVLQYVIARAGSEPLRPQRPVLAPTG
jgi:hypothetical protein